LVKASDELAGSPNGFEQTAGAFLVVAAGEGLRCFLGNTGAILPISALLIENQQQQLPVAR